MSDNDVPPPPDYSPIINAQKALSDLAIANSNELMTWAKDQFASNKQLGDLISNNLTGVMGWATDKAKAYGDKGFDMFREGADRLLTDARSYDTPERRAAEMGASQANVAQLFDQQRNNATRTLEGFGINPASTRYGALDLAYRAQEAAAQASAGNIASRNVEETGRQLNDKVMQYGLAGGQAGNQAAGVAQNAGQGAINTQLGVTASGANSMGTPGQWAGVGANALTGAGSTMNNQYENQMSQFKANQSNSSGIGSLLGTVAGLGKDSLGGSMLSTLGTAAMSFLEEGGMVPEQTQGGAVPVEASPSGGAIPDDVNAKVNAGEFVIPKDVTSWFGEKHFQNMIMKARKEKEGAPAKPQTRQMPAGAIPSEPSFQSRPMASAGALPLG